MTRWSDDIDVASIGARNRRAWAELEAQRAAKQIGAFANGVRAESMSGALQMGNGQTPAPPEGVPVQQSRTTELVPGPLTHQRAKADAERLRHAGDSDDSGAVAGIGTRESPRVISDAASSAPLRSGPPDSLQASPPVPAVSAAPINASAPKPATDLRKPESLARGHLPNGSAEAPIPCLVGKSTSKYRNKPTNGYASKREAKRAAELRTLQAIGDIRNLREQVPFLLIPKQDGERACQFVADFVYDERIQAAWPDEGWARVVEDVKGLRTPAYVIKRKLLLFLHGIRVRET